MRRAGAVVQSSDGLDVVPLAGGDRHVVLGAPPLERECERVRLAAGLAYLGLVLGLGLGLGLGLELGLGLGLGIGLG